MVTTIALEPEEAVRYIWPDDLAELIVESVAKLGAPRYPGALAEARALTPWAGHLTGRVRFTHQLGAIDLVVREFLSHLAHREYTEAARGLWLLRGLNAKAIEAGLHAAWAHPDAAGALAAIIRHNNAESFATLGQWGSAGTALDSLLVRDRYLGVGLSAVLSYRQRQLAGETVIFERVVDELHDALERLGQ